MPLGDTTFICMTYNLWGDAHAAAREPALREFIRLRQPDLLATQELRPWSRQVIDEELDDCERVRDDFPGWARQSNLWWRTSLFEHLKHGADDVGILDDGARFFWVRLRDRRSGTELVFGTAHLTWPGHADEQADGRGRRAPQATRIVERLDDLTDNGALACIFTSDVNDIGPANWALGNGGLLDSFTSLGQHSPVTHPVVPMPLTTRVGTRLSPLASPAKAIDWIFHRGPLVCRSSEVADFFHHASAPSDHKAVLATLTFAVPTTEAA
jgi:endonuclease/exonuclease/phosphatase family metal-dependent hydrolase